MALHTLRLPFAFEHRDSEVTSIVVGDAAVALTEVRCVVNAWQDYDAAQDLINETEDNSSLYFKLTAGQSTTSKQLYGLLFPEDVFYNLTFLVVGASDSAIDLTEKLSNIGKPILTLNSQNVLRTMITLRSNVYNEKTKLGAIRLT